MKIILIYPDLSEETEKEIINWMQTLIDNHVGSYPLNYVDRMEVIDR